MSLGGTWNYENDYINSSSVKSVATQLANYTVSKVLFGITYTTNLTATSSYFQNLSSQESYLVFDTLF